MLQNAMMFLLDSKWPKKYDNFFKFKGVTNVLLDEINIFLNNFQLKMISCFLFFLCIFRKGERVSK